MNHTQNLNQNYNSIPQQPAYQQDPQIPGQMPPYQGGGQQPQPQQLPYQQDPQMPGQMPSYQGKNQHQSILQQELRFEKELNTTLFSDKDFKSALAFILSILALLNFTKMGFLTTNLGTWLINIIVIAGGILAVLLGFKNFKEKNGIKILNLISILSGSFSLVLGIIFGLIQVLTFIMSN